MATEIGGIKLGQGSFIPDPSKAGAAEHAIADFFKGFSSHQPFTDNGVLKGAHSYSDVSGKKVTVYESSSKKAKLKDGEASVINGSGKKVIGSKGDDKVLVVDNNSHKIGGGKGNDTVVLAGNGSNKVDGGKGDDVFTVAGAGNNTFTGGKGNDTFIFTEGATGNNVIKDFKAGDVLKIADRTGDGVVKNGEDYTMSQNGKHTVISLKDGGSITLKKVDGLTQNSDSPNSSDDDGIFHI
jgi:Ca2+-binding RTX toxin-like protein